MSLHSTDLSILVAQVNKNIENLLSSPLFSGDPAKADTNVSEPVSVLCRVIPELNHLIGNSVQKSPEARGGIDPNQELLRTCGGLAVLAALNPEGKLLAEHQIEDLYQKLVSPQKVDKLTFSTYKSLVESSQQMLSQVEKLLPSDMDPDYKRQQSILLCALTDLFADLGKNKEIIKSIAQTGDHDVDFRRLIRESSDEQFIEMFPSAKKLHPTFQHVLRKSLLVSFNFGHIMQGETCPVALKSLLSETPEIRQFVIHHHIRDIAGARSHVISQGSDILIEQKVNDMLVFVEAAKTATITTEFFNDFYQNKKFPDLIEQYTSDKSKQEALALKLLALTFRVEQHPERIEPLIRAWQKLPLDEKEILIDHHSRTGSDSEKPFFVITYRPGFVDNLCNEFRSHSNDDLVIPVHCGLRCLAQIFSGAENLNRTDPDLSIANQSLVVVVGATFAKDAALGLAANLMDQQKNPVSDMDLFVGMTPQNGSVMLDYPAHKSFVKLEDGRYKPVSDFDYEFLKSSFEGSSVGGSLSLPDGTLFPRPPFGHLWKISDGCVSLVLDTNKSSK
jgi:hypothetical protein